ncbi:MAG: redoxin domain-containing protein, partial [Alphaproteobacteria bacterium]|nr:redoxin domain-containing protein [Alphaproteobacteria bacterium]
NTKPLGLSTDTVEEHVRWIEDVNDTQNTDLQFPIVADADHKVAQLYDMIHPGESETAAVRSVFIIDPQNKIRLTMTYPMSVGRNFDEILRVIDALQAGDKYKIATPADWQPGQKVIIPPSVTNDAAKTQFPQGWEEVRPYLRLTEIS